MGPADYGLDPARYFIDAGRNPPLVVEQSTGRPAYTIEHGRLAPYRRPAAPPRNGHVAAFAASGGGLSLTIAVGPPPEG